MVTKNCSQYLSVFRYHIKHRQYTLISVLLKRILETLLIVLLTITQWEENFTAFCTSVHLYILYILYQWKLTFIHVSLQHSMITHLFYIFCHYALSSSMTASSNHTAKKEEESRPRLDLNPQTLDLESCTLTKTMVPPSCT